MLPERSMTAAISVARMAKFLTRINHIEVPTKRPPLLAYFGRNFSVPSRHAFGASAANSTSLTLTDDDLVLRRAP
jgi:hypothetical protein